MKAPLVNGKIQTAVATNHMESVSKGILSP